MNKEINEFDRIVIGVREWSVKTVFELGMGMDRWMAEGVILPDTPVVLEEAAKLEEYVLRGISCSTEHTLRGYGLPKTYAVPCNEAKS